MVDPLTLVFLVVGLLLLLLVLGMPVAFALALCGTIGLALLKSLGLATQLLGVSPLERIGNYSLTMVPMFVLMGQLAFVAGMSRVAYDVGYKWLGRIPAGLGVATMAAGAIFGAVSGSSTATAAALGKVAIPEMRRLGYDKKLAAGCVASAALVDNLIPPSIGFVIYGIMTGESIGKLLISGVVPGLLTMLGFSLLLVIIALRAPHLLPQGAKTGWRERFACLPALFPLVLLFVVVIGGIYSGIVTSTEAAAIGAMTTFIMVLIVLLR
ncbi:MAG: TRAP transporter large permease subunit, partial [Deltaproteobacteria bacterium]|nr:TRAP transporter large permease subunit [Deltaproteobacteria bacterium]